MTIGPGAKPVAYQCCFCGRPIEVKREELQLAVFSRDGETSQHLWCHVPCLQGVLHQSVPFEPDTLTEG